MLLGTVYQGFGFATDDLACNAVGRTEYEDSQLAFTPVTSAEMVSMGVIYER